MKKPSLATILEVCVIGVVMFLIIFVMYLFAFAQVADVTNTKGAHYGNGEWLLTAGIVTPPPQGSAAVAQVCWRIESGAELGCVPSSTFAPVTNGTFSAAGTTVTITAKSPTSTPDVNLVAFKRVALTGTGLVRVRVRTVSDTGFQTERADAMVFNLSRPPAPHLLEILISELQSALERAREQIAAATSGADQ